MIFHLDIRSYAKSDRHQLDAGRTNILKSTIVWGSLRLAPITCVSTASDKRWGEKAWERVETLYWMSKL